MTSRRGTLDEYTLQMISSFIDRLASIETYLKYTMKYQSWVEMSTRKKIQNDNFHRECKSKKIQREREQRTSQFSNPQTALSVTTTSVEKLQNSCRSELRPNGFWVIFYSSGRSLTPWEQRDVERGRTCFLPTDLERKSSFVSVWIIRGIPKNSLRDSVNDKFYYVLNMNGQYSNHDEDISVNTSLKHMIELWIVQDTITQILTERYTEYGYWWDLRQKWQRKKKRWRQVSISIKSKQ